METRVQNRHCIPVLIASSPSLRIRLRSFPVALLAIILTVPASGQEVCPYDGRRTLAHGATIYDVRGAAKCVRLEHPDVCHRHYSEGALNHIQANTSDAVEPFGVSTFSPARIVEPRGRATDRGTGDFPTSGVYLLPPRKGRVGRILFVTPTFSPLFTTACSLMAANKPDDVSRRQFLRSLGLAGAVGMGGTLLTACGGGSDGSGNGSGNGSTESTSESATASADCSDLSSLSDAQKQQRKQMVKSLNYVEESPEAKKNCANCQLYQEEKFGAGCGGCQLFPGPVAEGGYCDSWAPMG